MPAPPRRTRRTDWRQGGRAVSYWDVSVLVATAVSGAIGLIGATLTRSIQEPWAQSASVVALWAGMLGAVVIAFSRARPAGLLRLRLVDLVWGLGVGIVLRAAEGITSGANTAAFPASDSSASGLSANALRDAFAAGLAGPLVEEFFFRAVLLVVLFQCFRRSLGYVAAGVTSLFASTGAFVCMHAVFSTLSLSDGVQLAILAVACSSLVLLTGRIWGAVLTHLTYNGTLLLIGLMGAILV